MQEPFDPFKVLAAAFTISSLGGLASLLRSNKPLTLRAVVGAVLNSGLTGLVIALTWYNNFSNSGNIFFLLGVSALAGIGGATVFDFILTYFKGGGVHIDISPRKPPKD